MKAEDLDPADWRRVREVTQTFDNDEFEGRAELPMVYIYAAWPFAGLSWMLFLGERFADHVRLYRSVDT